MAEARDELFSAGQSGRDDDIGKTIRSFDEYGFAVFDGPDPDTERCHSYDRIPFSQSDVESWKKLFSDWDRYKDKRNGRLQALVMMGVPAQFRAALWCKLLGIGALQNSPFCYQASVKALREQLVDVGVSEYGGAESVMVLSEAEEENQNSAQQESQIQPPGGSKVGLSCLRQIMLDLDRTYPTHRMFMGNTEEAKEGRAALFRVLAVYAMYNPINGYCQGMSYLAGLLLMIMGEVEAFWCLVVLLEKKKYLAGYYEMSLTRIQTDAVVFDKLLHQRFPKVRKHLKHLGLEAVMFITPWFMCAYTNLPCWDSVLAVWDMLMMEGYTAMFRVGIAILDLYQYDLLKVHELATVLPMLLHLPRHVVQRKVLMPIVWDTFVKLQELERLHEDDEGNEEENSLKRKQEWRSTHSVFEFTGSPSKHKKRRVESAENLVEKKSHSVFKRFMNFISHGRQPAVTSDVSAEKNGHVSSPVSTSAKFSMGSVNRAVTESSRIAKKYASQSHLIKRRTSIGKSKENRINVNGVNTQSSPHHLARPALKSASSRANSLSTSNRPRFYS